MQKFLLALAILFLAGCSNDDDVDTEDAQESRFSSFKALALDDEFFYEYTLLENSQTISARNLTLSDNINRQVEFIHEQDGVLGFYRERMVWIRDFLGEETQLYTDFVSPGDSERREGVVNNANFIVLLYRFPDSLEEMRLRIINVRNNVIANISLGVATGAEAYLSEGNIVVTTQNQSTAKVFVIDANAGIVLDERSFFNTAFLGNVFGEAGDFYLFDTDGMQYRFMNTATPVETRASQFLAAPGRVYEVYGTKIYSSFDYLQPSVFINGPQIYDLETDMVTRIDIQNAFAVYAAENDLTGDLLNTDFTYDVLTDTWLCNYVLQTNTTEEYGIFKLTNEGEITAQITTEQFVSGFLRVE